jgi:putative ABC transport system permease protein
VTAHPGFAAVVVVTMALGVGANSAIFSVLDGVVLRPLPYKDGHQIVSVRQQLTRADVTDTGFSAKEVLDYRAQSKTLSGLVEPRDDRGSQRPHGERIRPRQAGCRARTDA